MTVRSWIKLAVGTLAIAVTMMVTVEFPVIRPIDQAMWTVHLTTEAESAFNPSNVIFAPNIATMQALGAASLFYPQLQVQQYASTSLGGGGGPFTWNSSSTATADHCNIFAATGVTTGRWIRQVTAGTDNIPIANCGGVPDYGTGNTDNTTAIGYAQAAIEATGNFQYIKAGPGKWLINSQLTFDTAKEGIDLATGWWQFDNTATSGDTIHFISSNAADPEQEVHQEIKGNGHIYGPLQSGSENCLAFYDTAPGAGAVALISVNDLQVVNCGNAAYITTNGYLITFVHVDFTFNGRNLYMPPGASNSGENISFVNGSVLAGATTYAIDVENPSADVNVTNSSIDFNNTTTNCQIKNVDANVKIVNSHIESNSQCVVTLVQSGSTPNIDLTSDTIICSSCTTNNLLEVTSGSYMHVAGGQIYTAGTPRIVVDSGGNLYLSGTSVSTAVLSGAGTYTYCPLLGMCQTNQTQKAGQNQTNLVECLTAITVTTLNHNYALASNIPGTLGYFHDQTYGGSALATFDSSAQTIIGTSTITGSSGVFAVGWSSGPVIEFTAGTVPRTINYCQIGTSG